MDSCPKMSKKFMYRPSSASGITSGGRREMSTEMYHNNTINVIGILNHVSTVSFSKDDFSQGAEYQVFLGVFFDVFSLFP